MKGTLSERKAWERATSNATGSDQHAYVAANLTGEIVEPEIYYDMAVALMHKEVDEIAPPAYEQSICQPLVAEPPKQTRWERFKAWWS